MPDMIGQDISALANGATLHEKSKAYMLWGIDNDSHEIVGTSYDLQTLKKGNEELENWLRHMLSSNADFDFQTVELPEGKVGVLTIQKATNVPVTFQKTEYIRIGSYTKKLIDYPMIQRQLWDRLRDERFEERYAKIDLALVDALNYLDYNCYFELMRISVPTDIDGIAHYLIEEECIVEQDNGLYAITNLGAILFAKRLYLHACIKYVQGEQLTNSTLRERFGLKESSSGSVSRLIKEAVGFKLIKPLDSDTAPRYMKYIPFWA